MTVLEVIRRSAEFLAGKGIESPRLQVEWMLEKVLRRPRLELYLGFDRVLSEAELGRIREMVKRRGQREPLERILGTVCFCGIELEVGPGALVPRPETECLAESGWKFLNEISGKETPWALDFGAGTGCLAIALARHSKAKVTALEQSAEAFELARRNIAGLEPRIELALGSGFEALPSGRVFDLIISNPPYIPTAEIEKLEPEVRGYDPRQALDGGADGLDFFRCFATEAALRLEPGGKLMAEFGDGQGPKIEEIFAKAGWTIEAIKPDLTGRPRLVIALPKKP